MFFKRAFIYTITVVACCTTRAQTDSIGLWISKLNTTQANYDKVSLRISLAQAYINKNIDSSQVFYKQAQLLFPTSKTYQNQKENFLKTKLLYLEAEILVKVGKLDDGEKKYYDLLTQYISNLNIIEKAYCLLQLGVINDYQGKPVSSVKYYNKAYKIYDSLNYKKGTSECLNNMGVIFYTQGETDKGIEYLEQSLEIKRLFCTKSEIADVLENLGTMYLKKDNNTIAEKYYKEGLGYYELENNSWGMAYALKNLAKFNIKTKNYDEALNLCNRILNKHSGVSDSSGIAMINSLLSEVFYYKGDYKKSINYGTKAYEIGKKLNVAVRVYEAAKILKDAYKANKNFEKAFEFQDIYFELHENISNNKTVKETLKQRLEHEKEVERLSHENAMLIKESEARQKNLILLSTVLGFVVILFFSGLLLKKFKETKKQKKVIEEQKQEVEHKQKEILDSINYAKRIQQALLPTQKYIAKSIERLKK